MNKKTIYSVISLACLGTAFYLYKKDKKVTQAQVATVVQETVPATA